MPNFMNTTAMPNPKLSIIIPVYNEAENLLILHREISRALKKYKWYEVIYINDGSSDRSGDVLRKIARENQTVKVIEFVRNFGQTAALSAGINHSLGQIIVPIDSDLQNDPKDIPRLVKKIDDGYEVVSGWRKNRHDSIIRVIPSRIANWIIRKMTGVKIHDNGCSLKAYKREVIEGVQLYGEMHRFISVYASWSGGKVAEIVVNHRQRKYGKSNYGFSRIFKVILDLFVIRFLHTYLSRPIHFFGKYALYSFTLGVIMAIWALVLKFVEGTSISRTPLPVFSAICFIVGVQLVMTGILAELLMRTYYESQNKNSYILKASSLSKPSKKEF